MNFKAGERIRVYGACYRLVGPGIYRSGVSGFVEGIVTYVLDNSVHFKADCDGCEYAAHPKQCRRLKKKEPVTLWVNEYDDGGFGGVHKSKDSADLFCTRKVRAALLELRLVKRHGV